MSKCCGFRPSGRCGIADGSSTLAEFPAQIERGVAVAAVRLIGRVGRKSWYFPRPRKLELKRHCIRFEMRSNRLSVSDVGSALITEETSLGKL